jgi:hypothetical protein
MLRMRRRIPPDPISAKNLTGIGSKSSRVKEEKQLFPPSLTAPDSIGILLPYTRAGTSATSSDSGIADLKGTGSGIAVVYCKCSLPLLRYSSEWRKKVAN